MLFRKQPLGFSVNSDSVSAKRMKTLLPFKGLEANENPLMTTTGSCADILNMTVDDSAFLTLRPRIIDDPVYISALALANDALADSGSYDIISDVCKLKENYLFLVANSVITDTGLYYVVDGTLYDLSQGVNNRIVDITTFSDFLIFPEKDTFRFVKKSTGVHYSLVKTSTSWNFIYAPAYIPTYKQAIAEVSTLKTASVYEDLNILSDKYKLSFMYGRDSTLDLPTLAKNAVTSSGAAYITKDITGMTGLEILQHNEYGYIYFVAGEYATAAAVASGQYYDFHFYYYNYKTTTATTICTIRVYGTAGAYTGTGISKQNLALLYRSTSTVMDGNGRYLPKFIYDTPTNCIVRCTGTFVNPNNEVYVYKYEVSSKEYTSTTIIKTVLAMTIVTTDIYYGDGFVAYMAYATTGLALAVFNISTSTTYTLLGKVRPDGNTAFCARSNPNPVVENPIINIFAVNSSLHILSAQDLSFYTNQILVNSSTDNLLTKATLYPVAVDTTCLYYDIGATISQTTMVDLTAVANFKLSPNGGAESWLRFNITGTQGIFFPVTINSTYTTVLRVPFETRSDADTLSISNLLSANPGYSILDIGITAYGVPLILMNSGSNAVYLCKIDMDSSVAMGVLKYSLFHLSDLTVNGIQKIFPTADAFNVLYTSLISIITVTEDPIEYTYSLTTNATNPLVIDAETLAKYNEYKNAHLISGGVFGAALMSESRIYYNDAYLFMTEPNNYDYIPTIHCHKAAQPVRFASSYLKSIGVVYERNNVEYVSLTDNPFVTEEYTAHPSVLVFESVEQRAIDYKKNGHLVTFSGLTVYLNEGGLYGLNFNADTPQDTERKATLLSSVINTRLLKENVDTCILANSDPYVLLMFPKVGYTSVYAYKMLSGLWFYWELPMSVTGIVDDNLYLRLIGSRGYVKFTNDATPRTVADDIAYYEGNAEDYLDFDHDHIKWFWKSQPLTLGSVTARKQILETYFTFVNPNASVKISPETFEVTQNIVAIQRFGVRFYSYKDIITEVPSVEYEDKLNIINNLRRRTYLNRFKFCQLLCYNIEDENAPADKVRLADIEIIYKYLTGGR